jgi:N-acetylneuraminic acid mutarotase
MRSKVCRMLSAILFVGLIAFAGIALPAVAQTTTAPNEWTWAGGSIDGGEPPVMGTLGTPAAGNIPALRYQATTWIDTSGNLWLFGGSAGAEFNDLWKFNPATNEWAWMAGSSTGNKAGNYGTMGTPSAQNVPGGREDASGWTGSDGNFWLFGGYGYDASGILGVLNDLWEYNPSTGEWTWMSGSTTVGSSCFAYDIGETVCARAAVYGTLGTPAPGNTPGSNEGGVTWTDNDGNLWLFGGWSYDIPNQVRYYFDEVWKYNPSTSQWAWMGGSKTRSGSACIPNSNLWYLVCGEPGTYGVMGVPAPGNIPGGRAGAAKWTDGQGHLWLFSGSGFDANGNFGDPNDLWEFNPATTQWTWRSGIDAIPCSSAYCSAPAVYGTLGTPALGNIPLGRDHAVSWIDSKGNFWLLGGGGAVIPDSFSMLDLSDLWEFNPSTNEWALMGGGAQPACGVYCSSSPMPVHGVLGVPAPGNNPGTRFGSAGWTGSDGNFWLFGGSPAIAFSKYIYNNDLWVYQPSDGPLPTTATPILSLPTGSYASVQTAAISDSTNGAFIYYTTDGTTPTVNSTLFQPGLAPINILHSESLKAIAVASGCLTSAVATAVYTLPPQAATPTFSLPAGTYTSKQTVTISESTPGATIYYSTNGSIPTTSSSVYHGPISVVDPTTTLQAIATASGHTTSDVASAIYLINIPLASAPTFSVDSGTYATPQTVSISDSTPGAIIHYQINTYSTATSPVYSGPITVSSSETLYATATASGYLPSDFSSAIYDINPLAPQAAAPSFSVPAGTYTGPQTVAMYDTTNGAFIYYTTDGSNPNRHSTVYGTPITVSSTETLKAMAAISGYTASDVTSAAYTIVSPPLSFTITGTPISMIRGANAGNTSTISLTPMGGFTGVISLSCAITPTAASDPATCSIPASATISGPAAQTTVTVKTTSAVSSLSWPGSLSGSFMGGAALSCILLAGIPARRRRWRSILGMLALLFSVGMSVSCGGGGNGGGGGGNTGTTPGTYIITVTGTSGATTQTGTVSLTVQ